MVGLRSLAPSLRRSPVEEVYFVQAEKLGLIKIGLARAASERMRTLKVCSPDRLTLLGVIQSRAAAVLEREIHARFWDHNEHGEWFRPAPELLDFIAREVVGSADLKEGMVLAGLAKVAAEEARP